MKWFPIAILMGRNHQTENDLTSKIAYYLAEYIFLSLNSRPNNWGKMEPLAFQSMILNIKTWWPVHTGSLFNIFQRKALFFFSIDSLCSIGHWVWSYLFLYEHISISSSVLVPKCILLRVSLPLRYQLTFQPSDSSSILDKALSLRRQLRQL